MLLHVVQPPGPVDPSFDYRTNSRDRSLDHVQNAFFAVVNAFDNPLSIQRSGVARLTATGRIKSSAVQDDGGPTADSFGCVEHARFKFD
jgi:hypothetical protein